ncbi:dipeptidase PepE [bacterium]|nr:dipeptidase PepE [bacterium]
MHLLLLSNSTQYGSGYLDYCADDIKTFLGNARRIVFVPFALQDWDRYTENARQRLHQLGFDLRGIHQGNSTEQNILEADGFFAGGGNTFRLLTELQRQGLLQRIRKAVLDRKPYIGASAGSNIACPTIKTTNDMPIVFPPSYDALNLVPFNINPHYIDPDPDSKHQGETREQRIREYHEMNDNPVVGLREGSMLRVEETKVTVIGLSQARLFRKGQEPVEFAPGADLSFLLQPS